MAAVLFQWVVLNQDIPNSIVKQGDRGVIVDELPATKTQSEPGYILEIFQDGKTLEVVSVPISWVTPLPEFWDKSESKTELAAS
jgi:hypothetical protein